MTTWDRARTRLAVLAVLLVALAGCTTSTAASSDRSGDPSGGGRASASEPVVAEAASTGGHRAPAGSQLDLLAQLLASPHQRPSAAAAVPAGAEAPKPSGPPYRTGPRPGSPVIIPPPALPPGDATAYAVGDSVLLGTEPYLRQTLGSGWDLRFDARVGRRFPEGIDIVHENRASVGQVAIVLLGHNYGGGGKVWGYLDQLMADLGRAQRVVFVTVAEWSPAQPEVNRAIRLLPFRYPNVVVADWQAVIAANPQFLVSDHVHLTRAGDVALANLLAVMVGPAPARNGVVPPPPKILPIPDDAGSTAPDTTTTIPDWLTPGTATTSTSTTTTTAPGHATTTTSSTSTTTTTASTTTTTGSTTTSTTAVPSAGAGGGGPP